MGKNIIQQRRGRGSSSYRSPSHRHKGEVRPQVGEGTGMVVDLIHSPGRNCPLAQVDFDGEMVSMIAPEGLEVGQEVTVGENAPVAIGNTMQLRSVPEGTPIFNIESVPGDGGKMVRSAGTSATVISRGRKVVVMMPSGALKTLDPRCRATLGTVSGGGHKEKPFGKSGAKYHAYRSRSKAYFRVRGVAMNAADHPHGGGGHQHVGKPSTVSRNAPPGRKVGHLSPKRKKKRSK
ncbi:MAG: 50S ribosomal protein L2 [Methanomassiliicoccales archaeon]